MMGSKNKLEENKFVSRVYTKSGVYYIGDTKFSGHSFLCSNTLETMINNGEIDAVISPPRPKGKPMLPVTVIKYTLDTTMSPAQMWESYFQIKSGRATEGNTDINIETSTSEIVISEKKTFDNAKNEINEGDGFCWNLKEEKDPTTPPKKMRKVMTNTSSFAKPLPSSPSSTAETVAYELSDIDNFPSPTSSTAETITFDSSFNDYLNADIGPSKNMANFFLKPTIPCSVAVAATKANSQLIDALDLCLDWQAHKKVIRHIESNFILFINNVIFPSQTSLAIT